VVITKYFTSAVAGRWKRTTVSFHVQSLRSFFRYASSRGWCAAGIAESIDAPRLYTYENLPQGPSWEEVKKLLASAKLPRGHRRRAWLQRRNSQPEVVSHTRPRPLYRLAQS
jgi:site-specific recombinase XerD